MFQIFSDALFTPNAAPVDSVLGAAGVLVEETFHWLDARVGTDTKGDEGELAKDLIFGVILSSAELTRIKQEDDRGLITVNDQSVFVEQARIDGNNSNNTLSGTNSDDVIYGYNGNDYIYANSGNDYVYGGGNDDRIWGGNGNDKLWGEDGNDQLVGDAGNDEVNGGNGDDKVWGSGGDDKLWGERGNDQLTGDDGNDILNGYGFSDNERDTLIGGTGADRFILGNASSVFYSKNGNSDYAVIADFNRFEGDVISLKKLAFNNSSGDRAYGYRLAQVGANTEIRVENTNELVAVLQNRTGVSLLQGFAFEGTPKRVENDFDGDGQSDILWRHQSGKVHAWLMNGTQVSGRVDLESPGLDWQIQAKLNTSALPVIPDYKYNQADYLNTLYQDKNNNSMGRTDHDGTSAFDSSDNDDGKVFALVGGEVIEARNGKQTGRWQDNGTIAVYNKELNKTFIYWHFAEGSVDESIKGKTIQAGSQIGIEGKTGYSFGVHTHVQVHEGRVTVNMAKGQAPAQSTRLNLASVFESAVRKGLVKLYR